MTLTLAQYKHSLDQPPLCEQLKLRDITDDLLVQTNGSFVAGYRVSGVNSYYASDEGRNRTKLTLEALIRSLPERSMRLQARFEITEGTGDLLARYQREQRNPSPVWQALDHEQSEAWAKKEASGFYLRHFLSFYFIWDPRIHHQSPDLEWKKKMRGNSLSMSASKCIERSRREHEDLVAEFKSLMTGAEATMQATGMQIQRMTGDELFLEIKRALNPLVRDVRPYRRPETLIRYESARSQMVNVNIEDELDEYVKIGGLLYSFISLKDLPDQTFPGVLRELVVMDFPLVINAEILLPDQAKAVKQYKSRLRKMTAAQKDMHGGYRLNVDAQVAERQLVKVLQDLISSSLKSCQMSLSVALRTSRPARNRFEAEEAERVLSDRRQRILHAITRMNGARGIAETLAQKRFFFGGLPGLAEVTFALTTPQGPQQNRLLVSSDGKHAITGEIVPFGAKPFDDARAKLEKGINGPAKGPAKAPVTIVEFSDMQCPHCAKAAPTVEQLLALEPDAHFVFQNFPLPGHEWAEKAAGYVECVGQASNDAVWKFIEKTFADQANITEANADEKLKAMSEGYKKGQCEEPKVDCKPPPDVYCKQGLCVHREKGVPENMGPSNDQIQIK